MSDWKDATSYAQGERGKKSPNAWSTAVGPLAIWVGNDHLYNPGYWTMHCVVLGMEGVDTKLPASAEARTAQFMAVNLVKTKLKELSAAVSKIKSEETVEAGE